MVFPDTSFLILDSYSNFELEVTCLRKPTYYYYLLFLSQDLPTAPSSPPQGAPVSPPSLLSPPIPLHPTRAPPLSHRATRTLGMGEHTAQATAQSFLTLVYLIITITRACTHQVRRSIRFQNPETVIITPVWVF